MERKEIHWQSPNAQRAVWRKRGSGSPESLCKFGSLSPVRALVKAPPAAKPLGRCMPFGDSALVLRNYLFQILKN